MMKTELARQAAISMCLRWRCGLLLAALCVLSSGVQAAKPPTAGPANNADLAIVKAVDNPLPQEGGTIVYTLTLTNNGPKNANSVVVSDLLPAGLTYVSDNSLGAYNSLTGAWTPGRVTSGQVVQLAITLTVNTGTAGTTITNTATIAGSTAPDPVPGNNSSSASITVVAPNLTILKSAQTTSDPISGAASPYNIPGAIVLYSVQTTNTGRGVPDVDTVVITDPIPANTDLFVGDLGGAGSGPVLMIDGVTPVNSGLGYTFAGLASLTDDLEFSNDNGASWVYIPLPDINGYDANVTHVRVNPKGVMRASNGVDHPTFTLRFSVMLR